MGFLGFMEFPPGFLWRFMGFMGCPRFPIKNLEIPKTIHHGFVVNGGCFYNMNGRKH